MGPAIHSEPTTWTLTGFVKHVKWVHDNMPDHCFAWMLGAGASRPSGIPAAGELVARWLTELYERENHDGLSLEQWATAQTLGIKDFNYKNATSFYSRIFERRFRNNPDEGYACLEDLMAKRDPCPGYSILAKILETRHRVVITTNFDNLVADALAIYTDTFPFVCGHESLTSFVRVALRRPLICKIHRDLLLGPKNDTRSLRRLHESWAATLRSLFSVYTPIVIGYGGNDDSFMNLLESLDPGEIRGQMIWCYYEGSPPSERIRNVVAQHHGVLVACPGFDRLMILLGEKLGFAPLDDEITRRAKERAERYRKRMEAITAQVKPPAAAAPVDATTADVASALEKTLGRGKGWWAWELKAQCETDPENRETVYREAIKMFPGSSDLIGNFANFMRSVRKNHDEAETLYRKALELDPNNAANTGNFANFMTDVRKNHDEAEKLYRKALELDPNNAANTGNFANFMRSVRKNHDEAETLYRKALELDPNHANNTGNFASFLLTRGQTEESLTLLHRAWSLRAGACEQWVAEILLYAGIVQLHRGQSDVPAIARLKTLLNLGYNRGSWSFDDLLASAKPKLSEEDYALFSALAAAILDETKVADLDHFERWRSIEPIPLDAPWDL